MAIPSVDAPRTATRQTTSVDGTAIGRHVWAAARLSLASIFLWAFLDKLAGLGYGTAAERARIDGGSPTMGYLSSTEGWFAPFFRAIAGHPVTDALFMAALLGLGLALLFGVAMRVAATGGAILMVLMYLAGTVGVAGSTNPVVDDHMVYAIVLVGLALSGAGRTMGLGGRWADFNIVKRHPALE